MIVLSDSRKEECQERNTGDNREVSAAVSIVKHGRDRVNIFGRIQVFIAPLH